MDNDYKIILSLMYLLIFYWYFNNKKSLSTDFSVDYINNTGSFGLTAIISIGIMNYSKNSPGIWCLLSAIIAPLFIIL